MSATENQVCVLVSGGCDSAVLLARTLESGARVLPLYVRCGLRWEPAERYWLTRLLRAMRSPRLLPLRIIEVPVRAIYGAHWSVSGRGVPGARSADRAVELPGRNVLLLSHAAVLCARQGIASIAMGTLDGNPFRDASPAFAARMSAYLTQALGAPIRIVMPLRCFTKRQVMRLALDAPLALTFSCVNPRLRRHCGACNKCAERRYAFHTAGLTDPTPYAG